MKKNKRQREYFMTPFLECILKEGCRIVPHTYQFTAEEIEKNYYIDTAFNYSLRHGGLVGAVSFYNDYHIIIPYSVAKAQGL